MAAKQCRMNANYGHVVRAGAQAVLVTVRASCSQVSVSLIAISYICT